MGLVSQLAARCSQANYNDNSTVAIFVLPLFSTSKLKMIEIENKKKKKLNEHIKTLQNVMFAVVILPPFANI